MISSIKEYLWFKKNFYNKDQNKLLTFFFFNKNNRNITYKRAKTLSVVAKCQSPKYSKKG